MRYESSEGERRTARINSISVLSPARSSSSSQILAYFEHLVHAACYSVSWLIPFHYRRLHTVCCCCASLDYDGASHCFGVEIK